MAVANSPALTVQSWTVALGESGGAGEQSATPIAQQLSSTTSFHVVPADCSGRRWLHQSIIIFACAASCCLESAVTMYRSHLRRSSILDLRFKMIIFSKAAQSGPTGCTQPVLARCVERVAWSYGFRSSRSSIAAKPTRFSSSVRPHLVTSPCCRQDDWDSMLTASHRAA